MRVQSEKGLAPDALTTVIDTALPDTADSQVCVFPASLEQSRYWILDRLAGASTASNMAIAFRLEGQVEDGLAERSLRALTLRHEALRTTFRMVDGELSQIIPEEPRFGFSISDLRSLPRSDAEARAEALILEHSRVRVDLAAGPVFFAHLIHVTGQDHFLAFTIHQIACDGWSNGILVRDFAAIYTALSEDRPISLPQLPFQFADFTVWQQEWLESEQAHEALAFWREHIRRDMPAVDLPTDHPRSAEKSAPGWIESQLFPPGLTAKLKGYCRQHDATMHQVLLAAFQGLLSRYTGQTEFLLGSTIANRTQPGMEHVVGRFANPQVILADVQGDPTYRELVQRVADWSAKSYAHQDLPFSRLIEEFELDQSGATSQFLQIYFVYQKAFMQPQQTAALKVVPRPSVSGGVNFDLLVSVVERVEGPRLQIEYNTLLFERPRIRRLLRMYIRLLEAVMDSDRLRVTEFPLLAPEEKSWLEIAGRDSSQIEWDGQPIGSICSWLSRWAADRPEAIAIAAGNQQATWAELESKSVEFAAGLAKLGIRAGQTVAVRMEASVDAAVAALAVLRVGAAVLPIPATTDVAEWNLLLLALEPSLAVAGAAFAERVNPLTSFSRLSNAASQSSASFAAPPLAIAPDSAAWLDLKTDSAGRYGVTPATHRATLETMLGAARTLDMRPGDTVLVWPAQGAGHAWTDLLLPLLAGATIFHAGGAGPSELQSLLDRRQAAFALATPAEFAALLRGGWKGDPRLHMVCRGAGTAAASIERLERLQRFARSAGESSARHASRIDWLPASRLTAGPFAVARLTRVLEASPDRRSDRSTDAMSDPMSDPADSSRCALLPLAGQQLSIVDPKGDPVPYGVDGELIVRRRLWPGTENAEAGEDASPPNIRISEIHTGTLARYSPGRGFEIVDSADRLVRLHGYRLRLADLESALYRNPRIAAAEATLLASGGAPVLAAYISGLSDDGDQPLLAEEASALLQQTAPGHLSSAQLIGVPSIPRRADGAGNFSAMAKPGSSRVPAAAAAADPPRDEIESKLVKIWEEVLGTRGIGIRTSFFSLGGYSLTIVRLFARINKALGAALPITTIFNAPTIEKLADILRGRAVYSPLVPVQPNGTQPPLFMIHSYLIYEGLRKALGEDRPLYGLRELEGDHQMSIEDRAASYIREIRSVQPAGPYYLGGWCAAGPLAVEAARQLTEAGETVSMVALFDSWRPGYAEEFARAQATNPNMARSAVIKRKLRFHRMKLQPLSAWDKVKYCRDTIVTKLHSSRDKLYLRHWALTERLLTRFGMSLPHFMHNVSLKTILSVQAFKGRPFPGRITLIRATDAPYLPQSDPACGWNELAQGGVEVLFAPGTHESMFLEPNLSVLGNILQSCLERAAADADGPPLRSSAATSLIQERRSGD